MSKYECSICGYIYDEALGVPEEGIAPGTKWKDIPDDWECPLCGASKSDFVLIEEDDDPDQQAASAPAGGESVASAATDSVERAAEGEINDDMRQMSWGVMAALCSNLARGCEKQYLPQEQTLLNELAAYFTSRAAQEPTAQAAPTGATAISSANEAAATNDATATSTPTSPSIANPTAALTAATAQDTNQGFPRAEQAARTAHDRGALRALTWSSKVTRIVNTLLSRYESEGTAFLEGNNVYVCEICGFVFVGAQPPELCPICKVPSWKFRKIEGGRA